MFYAEDFSDGLRFGDIVRGFVTSAPRVDSPDPSTKPNRYEIEIDQTDWAVVLTPCCSIRSKKLVLTPLLPVLNAFYRNPYLGEDLTRVNRPMKPEQSVPPRVWDSMSEEDKAARFDWDHPLAYAFNNLFVYQSHDLLPTYELDTRRGRQQTGYYMVDFERACPVLCDQVQSPKQSPVKTKLLELSIDARSDLRDKLADYYGRVPAEDRV